MGEPNLKYSQDQVLKSLEELPTLPTVVYELTKIINDPMSSTNEVEEVMQNDMSLTTRVLKLANSAYYAIPGGVSSLSRAIAYIGFDTVNQLVLSASIIDALELKSPTEFDINSFWKHAIGVGIAAETIAKEISHPSPPDLFTAGLVHDMGKVALCVFDPAASAEIAKFAKANDMTFFDAETKFSLPKHTEIGQALAERWQLPSHMGAVIRWHHQKDSALRSNLSNEFNQNVDIVFIANLVVHALKYGNSGHDKINGAPTELMGRLGLNGKEDFVKMAKKIKSALEKAEEFISTLLGNNQ